MDGLGDITFLIAPAAAEVAAPVAALVKASVIGEAPPSEPAGTSAKAPGVIAGEAAPSVVPKISVTCGPETTASEAAVSAAAPLSAADEPAPRRYANSPPTAASKTGSGPSRNDTQAEEGW